MASVGVEDDCPQVSGLELGRRDGIEFYRHLVADFQSQITLLDR